MVSLVILGLICGFAGGGGYTALCSVLYKRERGTTSAVERGQSSLHISNR